MHFRALSFVYVVICRRSLFSEQHFHIMRTKHLPDPPAYWPGQLTQRYIRTGNLAHPPLAYINIAILTIFVNECGGDDSCLTHLWF